MQRQFNQVALTEAWRRVAARFNIPLDAQGALVHPLGWAALQEPVKNQVLQAVRATADWLSKSWIEIAKENLHIVGPVGAAAAASLGLLGYMLYDRHQLYPELTSEAVMNIIDKLNKTDIKVDKSEDLKRYELKQQQERIERDQRLRKYVEKYEPERYNKLIRYEELLRDPSKLQDILTRHLKDGNQAEITQENIIREYSKDPTLENLSKIFGIPIKYGDPIHIASVLDLPLGNFMQEETPKEKVEEAQKPEPEPKVVNEGGSLGHRLGQQILDYVPPAAVADVAAFLGPLIAAMPPPAAPAQQNDWIPFIILTAAGLAGIKLGDVISDVLVPPKHKEAEKKKAWDERIKELDTESNEIELGYTQAMKDLKNRWDYQKFKLPLGEQLKNKHMSVIHVPPGATQTQVNPTIDEYWNRWDELNKAAKDREEKFKVTQQNVDAAMKAYNDHKKAHPLPKEKEESAKPAEVHPVLAEYEKEKEQIVKGGKWDDLKRAVYEDYEAIVKECNGDSKMVVKIETDKPELFDKLLKSLKELDTQKAKISVVQGDGAVLVDDGPAPKEPKEGGKKKGKKTNWVRHVEKYAKEHKLTFFNALQPARASYKGGMHPGIKQI